MSVNLAELHVRPPLNVEGLLLAELADARQRQDDALRRRRQLIAYAREFHGHEPGLSLRTLAAAAGLSAEGVRIAYGRDDVVAVAEALGVPVPAKWRADT